MNTSPTPSSVPSAPSPATITSADRVLRGKIIDILPHGTEVDEDHLEQLLATFREGQNDQLQAANDLSKGYADQTASLASYISDYSVMAGKYYALAMSAVNTAEKLILVVTPPLAAPSQTWTVFKDTIRAVKEALDDKSRDTPLTGSLAILRERVRHLTVKGYDPAHDAQHTAAELAEAGICYIHAAYAHLTPGGDVVGYQQQPGGWPWMPDDWKPGTVFRNIEKGCALIAAAYDRQLVKQKEGA